MFVWFHRPGVSALRRAKKKNFSQQREKSTHQKRKHWSHSKNGCKLIFQFCAHHLGLHAPVSFSIRSFSIYFIIEAQNVSMLSVSFPCEKVCIRKPRILATLPKSPSSPPAASALVQKNPHFCSYILPFHCTLKFRCAIIMSIREGAAIAGGKMEVFYDGSFRGRAEHPAQASAMSHAIHKIVSKKRCQSYFISRRSPHHGKSKNRDL